MAGLRLLAWGLCVLAVLRPGAAAAHLGDINVDVEQPIATTSDYFVCATLDWWPPEKCDYGTCAWGNSSLLNLILLNAVSAFSPLVLRLGGTLQDKVFYATGGEQRVPCVPFAKNDSELFGFTQGCLTVARWDELHAIFKKSGAKVVFGLNALSRVSHVVGSGSDWDITNSASLIRYTVDKGYEIYGWELGNELGGKSIGALIPANQYASDVSFLTGFVDDVYQGSLSKPLVIAPGSFYEAGWFGDFITRTSPDMVGAVTHHIYSLGAGVDPEIMTRILDPRYLDGMASTFRDLQGLLKTAGTSAVAWVGEAGGAYNSGHHLVADAFVFSFWFLDQLAMSAKYDTKTYCRQSLIGGNHGLLNTTTFEPNPDYYSALLWHRLMGTRVLDTEYNGTTNKIRAYAHCAKQSGGITLLLINLHGNAHNYVSLPHEATDALAEAAGATREEYHLTPGGGNIQSQVMMLNGRALVTDVDGNIPMMEPITVDAALDIVMAPLSIVFAHLPDYYAPACS